MEGFLELVDSMGDDITIERAARVSFKYKEREEIRKSSNLIDYLIRNHHETPLEHVVFTFHIRAPIFVARQWFRHRIATYSEKSGRYQELDMGYWIPEVSRLKLQSKDNKQGSSDVLVADPHEVQNKIRKITEDIDSVYKELLALGLSKEVARTILPVSTYTEFIWTVNLRSLMNFLHLRLHPHAQEEIRNYAEIIYKIVESKVPKATKAFDRHIRYSKTIPSDIWDMMLDQFSIEDLEIDSLDLKAEILRRT